MLVELRAVSGSAAVSRRGRDGIVGRSVKEIPIRPLEKMAFERIASPLPESHHDAVGRC